MVRNIHPNPYATLGPEDWWHPERLPSEEELHGEKAILTATQVERFRQDGFIVVTGLWPGDLIAEAAERAAVLHPPEEVAARAKAHKQPGFSEMPWLAAGAGAPDDPLNHMTIHPRALRAVAQLLGSAVMDLRLSQSHVIAKYGRIAGGTGDRPGGADTVVGDQDIHVDYGNNTLLVPPRSAGPEAVACLCYYSRVEESGGATHFAPALAGELTTYEPKTFNPPNFVAGTDNGSAATETGPRSPANTARRYRDERPVRYQPGTCILYRLDAWHRGTPAAVDRVRYTHHHVWRHRRAEWVNWQSLAPRMAGMPTRYLSTLTVEQRTVLGFAAPGDSYWSAETIDAVGRRYPEMDMTPYRTAQ